MVLLGFGTYNYLEEHKTQSAELQANAQAALDRLSLSLGDPLWNYNDNLLNGIVESEMAEQDVLTIWIESDGKLRSARGRGKDWEVISIDAKPETSSFDVTQDILFTDGDETQIAGQVTLYIDERFVDIAIQKEMLKQLGQTVLLDIILFFLISQLINRLVVSPLQTVTQTVKDISEGEGDLTHQLNDKGKDGIKLEI